MKNQKIVIIGGSSGIGLETAKQVISLGAEVVIASRSEDKLHKAKEMLGPRAATYVLDTTDEQQVSPFLNKSASMIIWSLALPKHPGGHSSSWKRITHARYSKTSFGANIMRLNTEHSNSQQRVPLPYFPVWWHSNR